MKLPNYIIAVSEQVALSLLSFGSALFLAATSSKQDYALFTLALATNQVVIGFYRSTVVVPFIYRDKSEDSTNIYQWDCMASIVLIVLNLIIVILALLIFVFTNQKFWSGSLFCGVTISAGTLQAEYIRRKWLDQELYYKNAFFAFFLLILVFSMFFIIYFYGFLNAHSASIVISICYLIVYRPYFVFLSLLKKDAFRVVFRIYKKNKTNIVYSNLSSTIFAVYNHLLPFFVGTLGGAMAIAEFSASRLISQPVWVLVAGLDNHERAQAAVAYQVDGVSGVKRRRNRYIALSVTSAAVLSVFIYLLSLTRHASIFFEHNNVTQTHILMWLLAGLIVSWAFPCEVISHVSGRQAETTLLRTASALASLICMWLAPIEDVALRGIFTYIVSWLVIAFGNLIVSNWQK